MNPATSVTDTSAEAEAVQLECLRRMSPHERLARTLVWSRDLRRMSLRAIRRRFPNLDEVDVRFRFIQLVYGKDLAEEVRHCQAPGRMENALSELDDLVAALSPVVSAFRDLQVRHYVAGSVASSFHGAVRSTMDVDLVCELPAEQIPEFVSRFDADFYVSESAIREAVRRKSCFNLIHLPTSFKPDLKRSVGGIWAKTLGKRGKNGDSRRADSVDSSGGGVQQVQVVTLQRRGFRQLVVFAGTRSAADAVAGQSAERPEDVAKVLDRFVRLRPACPLLRPGRARTLGFADDARPL